MHSLPVVAISADPSNLGTADCALICHCDDGSDYAVKNLSSGQYVAHSEWFCKHLGDQIGIASPTCRLVEVQGETAFGSRWESGHLPDNWWLRVRKGEIEKDRISSTVSRIFAYDLFINNIDRHTTNYIVRPQAQDKWAMSAFDHSKAWMATGWPLANAPMATSIVTRKNFRMINQFLNSMLIVSEALFVLEKIKNVSAASIQQILDCQYDDWLSKSQCDDIINFWKDGDMVERVEKIEKGFKNGEYV